MTLENDILNEIKPTPEECREILDRADRLKKLADAYIEEHGLKAEARSVGSVGKGTYLRNPDIDLFLMFSEDVPRAEMERQGLQAGRDLVGGVMMFAEHPYTSGKFEGMDVVMVPCYAVRSATAIKTEIHITIPLFFPVRSPRKGTKTMYIAVMKPAFPASRFRLIPNCWRFVAQVKTAPQQSPPIKSVRNAFFFSSAGRIAFSPRLTFPLSIKIATGKRTAAPIKERTAVKVKGGILSVA